MTLICTSQNVVIICKIKEMRNSRYVVRLEEMANEYTILLREYEKKSQIPDLGLVARLLFC